MKDYKYAVFIGRFQPFHKSHLEVVKHGLSIADKLIIVIGSANSAPTIKNPFTFEDRSKMIVDSIESRDLNRVSIVGVRDYYYSDNTWISDIQAKTDEFITEGDPVALLGDYKDGSSYYLKYFPQWDFKPMKSSIPMDATTIRDTLFKDIPSTTWGDKGTRTKNVDISYIRNLVPDGVYSFLTKFIETEKYINLCEEAQHLKKYKESWSNVPYPVTFVTADSVVTCSGHVLVIKRKFNPGKGLYALPGGFIKQDETLQTCAIRELKEETGIRIDKIILSSSIVDNKIFDHPSRSLRGRTITHAFHVKLKDGKLPEVRGNDDASQAIWLPIMDIGKFEEKFFEDHAHIVSYFLSRS